MVHKSLKASDYFVFKNCKTFKYLVTSDNMPFLNNSFSFKKSSKESELTLDTCLSKLNDKVSTFKMNIKF